MQTIKFAIIAGIGNDGQLLLWHKLNDALKETRGPYTTSKNYNHTGNSLHCA
jgi:hypothetical protein